MAEPRFERALFERLTHIKRNQGAAEHPATSNLPEPYESFILAPGEKKVEMKLDTRMPNTSIFTFNKEDHTLGNLLRSKLLSNSHVTFAAYKVPHPLFPTFELHVRTDGQITPKEALLGTCRELVNDLQHLGKDFAKEFELRKLAGGSSNGT